MLSIGNQTSKLLSHNDLYDADSLFIVINVWTDIDFFIRVLYHFFEYLWMYNPFAVNEPVVRCHEHIVTGNRYYDFWWKA